MQINLPNTVLNLSNAVFLTILSVKQSVSPPNLTGNNNTSDPNYIQNTWYIKYNNILL